MASLFGRLGRWAFGGTPDRPADPLESSPDWQIIAEAWTFANSLVGWSGSTTAEREQAKAKFHSAAEAAGRMVSAGLIVSAEAGLLRAEAERILARILMRPPSDLHVRCYRVIAIPPARISFQRLAKRLPLLAELAKGGKVHRAAMAKTLATVEADLKTLSKRRRLAALGPEERPKAEETRDAVKAEVEKLKKLLGDWK